MNMSEKLERLAHGAEDISEWLFADSLDKWPTSANDSASRQARLAEWGLAAGEDFSSLRPWMRSWQGMMLLWKRTMNGVIGILHISKPLSDFFAIVSRGSRCLRAPFPM